MKKYILLALSIVYFSCKAQQTYPMNQDYSDYLINNNYIKDTNNDLNKFVGVWKWTSPTNPSTYFEVHLIKVLNWKYPSDKFKYYRDVIFGNYKYVENGIIVTNNLNRNNYNSTIYGQTPIIIADSRDSQFKNLSIIMRDILKNDKLCKPELNIINLTSVPLTANWTLIETGQIMINPQRPAALAGFSIPTNIVLTKQ